LVAILCCRPTYPFLAAGETTARHKIAIAPFVIPAVFSQSITSATLVDLLLKAARDSQQYEAVIATDQLREIIRRWRSEQQAGQLPPQPDGHGRHFEAEYLLLPSASRVESTTLLTASLVDLRTFKLVDTFTVRSTGEATKLFEMVGMLWNDVDAVCSGSFRIIADGTMWDQATSWSVVSDASGVTAVVGARRHKSDAKQVDTIFCLHGTHLLRTELWLGEGKLLFVGIQADKVHQWDHDGMQTEIRLPYDGPDGIVGMVTKHWHIDAQPGSTFDIRRPVYLVVFDRRGRTRRFNIATLDYSFDYSDKTQPAKVFVAVNVLK
jgi:hypothetical protein